jgi:hypothetical protein
MSRPYLTQVELAALWRISPRTLERWRWAGEGPSFVKIGGRVRYRPEDVESFEANHLRRITGPADQNSESPERIAPSVKTTRGRSTYADLRSFSPNGRRPATP